MGADYEGQEKGIEELRGLGNEGKKFIGHHIRNSLTTIQGNMYLIEKLLLGITDIEPGKSELLNRLSDIQKTIKHIVEDLDKIGC